MNLYTDSWLQVRVVVSIFRSLHFPCLRSMLRNGWGGVGCLHIERETTSVVYPRPRTTYVNTRLVEYGWCSLPAVCKTQLSAFASMLPRCTAHMLKTISLHFSRMNLNDCRFWDGPIVLQRLARFNFTTSKPPTSILWHATFDIPTLWCGVTRLKNCESQAGWTCTHVGCYAMDASIPAWERHLRKCGGKMETRSAPKRRF